MLLRQSFVAVAIVTAQLSATSSIHSGRRTHAPSRLHDDRYADTLLAALDTMVVDIQAQTAPVVRVGPKRAYAMHPITFSIPRKHVQDFVQPKARPLASIIPGDMSTYAFVPRPNHTEADLAHLERAYFEDMQRSFFGVTWKKAGWDCLRHVELLASGCVPLFTDIGQAPRGVLALYPKKVLALLLRFPGIERLQGVPGMEGSQPRDISINADRIDLRLYAATANALLDYTRRHLTSDAVAAYMLTRMGVRFHRVWEEPSMQSGRRLLFSRRTSPSPATKVLFLSMPKDTVDYMTDTLLHGLKTLLGNDNVVDHHRRSIIYQTPKTLLERDWAPKRSQEYGWGFTYAHSMLYAPNATDYSEAQLRKLVAARHYDVVVLALVHRGQPPLLDAVCRHYPRSRVAVVHGHDRPPTNDELEVYNACSKFQFVREPY